jgi:hypothetical protein
MTRLYARNTIEALTRCLKVCKQKRLVIAEERSASTRTIPICTLLIW